MRAQSVEDMPSVFKPERIKLFDSYICVRDVHVRCFVSTLIASNHEWAKNNTLLVAFTREGGRGAGRPANDGMAHRPSQINAIEIE